MTSHKQQSYWIQLWFQPRSAVPSILASDGAHGMAVILGGLFGALQSAPAYLSGEKGIIVFLPGILLGICGLYFFAWLLRNFGRWFQSSADLRAIRTVMGVFLLPWTLLFGGLLFMLDLETGDVSGSTDFSLFFIGFLYGYVLLLLGLSEALKISLWKTFFCLIITALVSFFPLTLFAQLIFGAPAPSA